MCGGKKLIIADFAGSRKAKKRELNLYLSPHKLTEKDLENVKQGGMWAPGTEKEIWMTPRISRPIQIELRISAGLRKDFMHTYEETTATSLTKTRSAPALPNSIPRKNERRIPLPAEAQCVEAWGTDNEGRFGQPNVAGDAWQLARTDAPRVRVAPAHGGTAHPGAVTQEMVEE